MQIASIYFRKFKDEQIYLEARLGVKIKSDNLVWVRIRVQKLIKTQFIVQISL